MFLNRKSFVKQTASHPYFILIDVYPTVSLLECISQVHHAPNNLPNGKFKLDTLSKVPGNNSIESIQTVAPENSKIRRKQPKCKIQISRTIIETLIE